MLTPKPLFVAAKSVVQARIETRTSSDLVGEVSADRGDAEVRALSSALRQVSERLGLDFSLLDPGKSLGENLRVRRNELPAHLANSFDRFGLADHFDPFAFDLLEIFERRTGDRGSELSALGLSSTPRTEDEWIEAILALKPAQFLRLLA